MSWVTVGPGCELPGDGFLLFSNVELGIWILLPLYTLHSYRGFDRRTQCSFTVVIMANLGDTFTSHKSPNFIYKQGMCRSCHLLPVSNIQ